MSLHKPKNTEPWRDFLTADESDLVRVAEDAHARWQSFKGRRAEIISRATQRAKAIPLPTTGRA